MPTETKECEHCGVVFSYERVKKHRKYCSSRCRLKTYYRKNPEVYSVKTRRYRGENPIKHWLYSVKKRARQKNLDFNLTVGDVKIPDKCPVLGIVLKFSEGKASNNSPSIDRVDNKKGYTKDNIRVISMRANSLKRDASIEELALVLEDLKKIQNE